MDIRGCKVLLCDISKIVAPGAEVKRLSTGFRLYVSENQHKKGRLK
jgi:hypothetical protein